MKTAAGRPAATDKGDMMGCYCDFEPPSFINTQFRKARKQHKCCECGHIIEPGDVYEYVAGKWDGRLDTFKTCEPCADLRDSLAAGGCFEYRGLNEEYWNYLEYSIDREQVHAAVFAAHRAGRSALERAPS